MLMACKLRVFSIGRLVEVVVIVKFVEEWNRNVQFYNLSLIQIYGETVQKLLKEIRYFKITQHST